MDLSKFGDRPASPQRSDVNTTTSNRGDSTFESSRSFSPRGSRGRSPPRRFHSRDRNRSPSYSPTSPVRSRGDSRDRDYRSQRRRSRDRSYYRSTSRRTASPPARRTTYDTEEDLQVGLDSRRRVVNTSVCIHCDVEFSSTEDRNAHLHERERNGDVCTIPNIRCRFDK